jgi:hypothetical protein
LTAAKRISGNLNLFHPLSAAGTSSAAVLTPERLQLKVHLRHFKQERAKHIGKKYFDNWRNFVANRKCQQRLLVPFLPFYIISQSIFSHFSSIQR